MAVVVSGGSRRAERRAIARLRRFGRSKGRPLAAPRLPASAVRDLRRVERAYRTMGSVGRVRARLRISRSAIRLRLRLGSLLRAVGPIRTTRCG